MSRKSRKQSRALIRTTMAVSGLIIAGSLVGKCLTDHYRNERVDGLVARFKGCPQRFARIQECHTAKEKTDMESKAAKLVEEGKCKKDDKKKPVDEGKCKEAGMIYAKVNRESRAREMIGACESRSCRRDIIKELDERKLAIEKAKKELGQ